MVSRQHQDWINHGKPDSGLVLPLQLMANELAAAGYTVYVYPNDAHLDAEPPEDHTYYSETGWPNTSPKWWRHAIDIMPPPAAKNLPSLQTLGQNIYNARQNGQITWLKYMNWPSDGNLNRAVQDRWEPNHSRGNSGDTGHIHLSSVTGVETLDESFNPMVSVIIAGTTTPNPIPKVEEMTFLAKGPDGLLWLCREDAMQSRVVGLGQLGDIVTLINEGLMNPIVGIGDAAGKAAPKGSAKAGAYFPREGWNPGAFGPVAAPVPPASTGITEAQVAEIAAAVVAQVARTMPAGTALSVSQVKAANEAALKEVLSGALNAIPTQQV